MSDLKAFAKFPAMSVEGGYHLIDIYQIEAISQSQVPTAAVIFGPTDRFYSVEVPQKELDRAGEADAAGWCLALISKVAQMGMGIYATPEADDEDDFTPNAG